MTSTRPYFIRALYEWILDNQCTPYLLVNALYPSVQVPQEHVKDGRIILNLSPSAIRGLVMDNERVEFSARFGGVPRALYLPIGSVLAVYAKENGRGMFFDENEFPIPEQAAQPSPAPAAPAPAPLTSVETSPKSGETPDDPSPGDNGGGGKKRPSLKVVK